MLTLVKEPFTYQPAGNPVNFSIASTNPAFIYAAVNVYQAGTSNIIFSGKYFPTPSAPTTVSFNLSNILLSLVKSEVDNSITPVLLKPAGVLGYYLGVDEYCLVGGAITKTTTLYINNSGLAYNVWDAQMDILNFQNFTATSHVINSVTTLAKFLTLQPNYKKISDSSFEQLYFLNKDVTNMYLKILVKRNNVDVYPWSTNFLGITKLARLNVSIQSLFNLFPGEPAYSLPPLRNVLTPGDMITLYLYNGDTYSVLSELRSYIYKALGCSIEAVNLIWLNSLGGYDSYQFINPQESTASTKLTLKHGELKSGAYYSNGIYNIQDEIYSSNSKSTVKVYTQELNDAEAAWLSGLVNSKQVYVQLANGGMVPVTITDTNYTIQRKKYMVNSLNQYQFTFAFADNISPAISTSIVVN